MLLQCWRMGQHVGGWMCEGFSVSVNVYECVFECEYAELCDVIIFLDLITSSGKFGWLNMNCS